MSDNIAKVRVKKSKTFLTHLPEILNLIDTGYTHKSIIYILKEKYNFIISIYSFRKYYYDSLNRDNASNTYKENTENHQEYSSTENSLSKKGEYLDINHTRKENTENHQEYSSTENSLSKKQGSKFLSQFQSQKTSEQKSEKDDKRKRATDLLYNADSYSPK